MLALTVGSGCYVSSYATDPGEESEWATDGGEAFGESGERDWEEEASDGVPTDEEPADEGPINAQLTGEELFLANCAGCHGATAEGTASAYELRHVVPGYARHVVRQGRPGVEFPSSQMPAFSSEALSDEALDKILDYLASFPQPMTGEELFADYCRNCHGADAGGGVVGTSLHDEDFDDLLDTVRDGNDGNDYGDRGKYMPSWSSAQLSEEEIAAIADYVRSLR